MKIKLTTMKFKCIKEKTITIDSLSMLEGDRKSISYIEFPIKEFHNRYIDYIAYKIFVETLKISEWK